MTATNEAQTLPPAAVHLSRELVDGYRTALQHRHSNDVDTDDVPPSIAGVILYAAIRSLPETSGVILVGQSYRLHRALRVGETVTIGGVARVERDHKDRRAMRLRCEATDEHGSRVLTAEIVRLLPEEGTDG